MTYIFSIKSCLGARVISNTYSGTDKGLTVECTGNEEQLLNCTITQYCRCWNGYASLNCTVSECSEGAVDLVGGMNETEGRVEICLYGLWGIVCDSLWTVQEAKIVCKQLGYLYTGIYLSDKIILLYIFLSNHQVCYTA